MRRICYLMVCTIYLLTVSAWLYADSPDAKAAPTRGIAVLASSIGSMGGSTDAGCRTWWAEICRARAVPR